MKLSELLTDVVGYRIKGRKDIKIEGIAYDSRMVRTGYIFAALPGYRKDGHEYVDEAKERGAAAILVQKDVSNSGRVAVVIVDDTRSALARVSDRFYGNPSKEIEVIGVTGTNGKTTVCYLTRRILAASGRRPALIGTIEYLIGKRAIPAVRTTPESPHLNAMIREAVNGGCDCLVMEVSSHALVQRRVEGIDFDIAVFTNLGSDHLDFHGSREEYFVAKTSLFRLPRLRRAVVNADDSWGRKLVSETEAPVITYGSGEEADVRASSVRAVERGIDFDLETGGDRVPINLPLRGEHNMSNALAAATVALSMGIGMDVIASALSEARPVTGRLEEVGSGCLFRVFIDYAHTEEALESALLAVREGCEGRVILVFGCGGDRYSKKRLPMGRVAARLADISFITSDNPRGEEPGEIIREIAKGFRGAGKEHAEIPDRRKAITAALAEARAGDIVLVAGKGHESTQEFANTVVPFSDRDVVEEILKAREE